MAARLLGCRLVVEKENGIIATRIVETEAYYGSDDAASHAFRGMTPRNRSMFLLGGHAYVYFTYGMHFCLNVVTGDVGEGCAVLLRAAEVLSGHDLVAARRPGIAQRDWLRGPGRLCLGLGIDKRDDGRSFHERPIRLYPAVGEQPPIATSPRIGISKNADVPLRFFFRDSPWVSGPKSVRARKNRDA